MSEYKEVETRIITRHDIAANWKEQTWIPLKGEVIIYDPDYDSLTNTSGFKYPRFKVGDGIKTPFELPFASMPDVVLELDDIKTEGIIKESCFLQGFAIANDGEIRGSFKEVDTETVVLKEPFTLTRDFGYYTLGNNPYIKVGEAGQSLHDFLKGAFSQEDTTVFGTFPSATIAINGSAEGEIGSTINPLTASWVTSSGVYKYGTFNPATLEANFNDKSTKITYTGGDIRTASGSELSLGGSITFTEAGKTLTVEGEIFRDVSEMNVPISNIGKAIWDKIPDEYTSNKTIPVTNISKTFTGYRNMFYVALADFNPNDTIDRSYIDTKNFSRKKAGKGDITVTANVDDKVIIWAIPSSFTNVSFKYWFNKDWQTLGSVTCTTGTIEGANNEAGVEYNIYKYSPAAGIFEAEMQTKVTIS